MRSRRPRSGTRLRLRVRMPQIPHMKVDSRPLAQPRRGSSTPSCCQRPRVLARTIILPDCSNACVTACTSPGTDGADVGKAAIRTPLDVLIRSVQALDPPCQTRVQLGAGRQLRRLPCPRDHAMPTRSVGPADTSSGVPRIDLKAHDRLIAPCWYNNRERLERGIERELQALRRDTLTEPRRHVPRHDADGRRTAQEDRRHALARAVADHTECPVSTAAVR